MVIPGIIRGRPGSPDPAESWEPILINVMTPEVTPSRESGSGLLRSPGPIGKRPRTGAAAASHPARESVA